MTVFLSHAQTQDGLSFSNNQLTVKLRTDSKEWMSVQVRHEPDNEEYFVDMTYLGQVGRLHEWQASFEINHDKDLTKYVFKVQSDNGQYWLDARGVQKRIPSHEFHFKFNAKNQPPEWVSEQVFYQIFPDRFCNGNPEISVKSGEYALKNGECPVVAKEWGEPVDGHGGTGAAEFYGGDLVGINQKLDYLQDLGITAIYLNPIFTSPSNHKYDTQDYMSIDPHLGTEEDFVQLRTDTKQRGMKLILDAVFNHTSTEHAWFDRMQRTDIGAYNNPESPYHDYYFFDKEDSTNYIGWKGIDSLPVLNFENQQVKDYIYQSEDAVIKHWLRAPYDIDGWRFDVIHMLGEGEGAKNNAHYVQAFREATKQENPEAYVLGEHFFEATPWLQGDQEDGAMNYYGFAHPLRALIVKQDIAYQPIDLNMIEFRDWLAEARAKVPWLNQLSQLNQLDSHDTARFISLIDKDESKLKVAATLLMTYLGAPCLYYGTEVGLEGGQDPDNRRCFPWGEENTSPWFSFFQSLVELRKSRISLQKGHLQELYCDESCWAFARVYGEEVTIIAVNHSEQETTLSIPVWKLGIEEGALEEFTQSKVLQVIDGKLELDVSAMSAVVLK